MEPLTLELPLRGTVIVTVTHFFEQKPAPMADSDWDARGYVELDYEVRTESGQLIEDLTIDESTLLEAKILDNAESY